MYKKISLVVPLSTLTVSILCALSSMVYADTTNQTDEEDNKLSDTVTVVATNTDQDDQFQTVINRDDIVQNKPETISDLFRNQSSVFVGGGSRQAQRIYVRGIEATNLNVTIDGAKQGRNLFQHRGNTPGIDPYLLKAVNITTLPSSDQGSGALGGSIQYETVDAQDLLKKGEHFGGRLKSSYGSVNDSKNGAVTLYGISGEHLGIVVHINADNSQNYTSGDGTEIKGSGGKDREYYVKVSGLDMVNNDVSLTIEQNVNRGFYRFRAGDTAYDPDAVLNYQVLRRNTYTLNHRYLPDSTGLIDLKDSVYYTKTSLDNQTSSVQLESEVFGGSIANISSFTLFDTDHKFSYGFDYYDETGQYVSSGTQVGNDNQATNLGLYVQERMTWGPVLFSVGTRFDHFNTDYGTSSFSDSEFSPSAGLDYELIDGLHAFYGYGEAIRSTGVIPLQWLAMVSGTPTFNAQSGKNSYNQSFKPESSTRNEYGINYEQHELWSVFDYANVKFTVFDTEINNLIQPIGGIQGQAVTGFYNDDPVISKGYEAQINLTYLNIDTRLSFTHSDTVDQDGNIIVVTRRVAAATGNSYIWNTQWHSDNDMFRLSYVLKYVDSLRTGNVNRDGYAVHDINAVLVPSIVDGLTLSLNVINVFDKNYAEQTTIGENGTAVYEAGRDIRLGIEYEF